MSKYAAVALVFVSLPLGAEAQVFDGLTLYNTLNSRTTRLIDNSGATVHSWTGTVNCAYVAYLMPDSTIWRDDVYSGATMRGAAYGGLIQRYNWDGDIIQSFIWSNSNHQQHHDIHPMDNGHVLVVSWDRKTAAQAQALGRQNITGDIWPDEVVEYDPVGDSVVWEWHFWDHLIQDVNPSLPNYGVVSEHPELLDINLGSVQGGDWMHCNGVDYNEERDEVVLTSHNLHEVYVIDHSTTTAEAAGHTGGRHGKGGDFLYRWGNPQNYDRGTSADRVFYVVHGANWIPSGLSGAGDIIVLNNGDRSGNQNDYSVVTQITPPLDSLDHYYISPDSAFGPTALTWSYQNGSAFYTQHLGGSYRLPNGNTFALLGTNGVVDEITPSGTIVWTRNLGGQIGKCLKYPRDFATGVTQEVATPTPARFLSVGPNPFITSAVVCYELARRGRVSLTVHDAAGRRVACLYQGEQDAGSHTARFIPASGLAAGVYFVRLETVPAEAGAGACVVVTRQLVKGR
jgi:hypothetical protein